MEVVILPDAGAVARLAADAVERVLRTAPAPVLGLATGSTPMPLYAELIRRHREAGLSFAAARAFMDSLPLQRTAYIQVAAHYTEPDGLIIDTHGAEVIDPVWSLHAAANERIGEQVPTCLERDFNFGDFSALTAEVRQIARRQAATPSRREAA